MVISIVYSKNDDSSHVTKSTRSPIGNNSQEAKKNQNDSYSELPDENDIAPDTNRPSRKSNSTTKKLIIKYKAIQYISRN